MRLAIFDIDGTLLQGASSERRFARHLFRNRMIGPRQMAWFVGFLGTQWPRHGIHINKKNKSYLDGLTTRRIASEAARFVDEELWNSLDAGLIQQLRRHLENEDRVVLLSGTLQPIADALAKRLGAHLAVGAGVPERDGFYRHGHALRHPFGREKLALTHHLCAEAQIPMENVIAYGDSIHDQWLLESAGSAVAVNPDDALRRLALRLRWKIWDHGQTTRHPRVAPRQ